MGRPSAATVREYEIRAASERAAREAVEALANRLMDALAQAIGANAAAHVMQAATVPAPVAVDPVLEQITTRVRSECDRWADTPRQRAINLNFAYDLARKGKKEAEIVAAIRRGEVLETAT